MNVVNAKEAETDAVGRSELAFAMPIHVENEAVNTCIRRIASNGSKAKVALRDALQGDDRQVLASSVMRDAQLDERTGSPANERMGSRTWRAPNRECGRSALYQAAK